MRCCVCVTINKNTSEFCLCPTLVTRRKNIFLYFITELKIYHLSTKEKNLSSEGKLFGRQPLLFTAKG